jgi:hypothetical protein
MRRLALLALALLGACNGIDQSPECAQYMACVEAISPGGSVAYESSYGERGTCWSTDGNSARRCTAACVQGRATLGATTGQGKAECQ